MRSTSSIHEIRRRSFHHSIGKILFDAEEEEEREQERLRVQSQNSAAKGSKVKSDKKSPMMQSILEEENELSAS